MLQQDTLMEAVFRITGDVAETRPHAAGPWSPDMQHGSPSAALVTWAAEQIPTPRPMRIARVTIDLMRPVPLAPLTIARNLLREGRKIQLSEISLRANGVEVVRGTVLKVRSEGVTLPDGAMPSPLDLPGPDAGVREETSRMINPFIRGMSIASVRGRLMGRGPAAIWYRSDRPMIEGEATSPAMRAVIASDFSNATSPLLDFRQWLFLNADLTVSMARDPVGEWVLLNGETIIGPDGRGVATARLADEQGYFGRSIQNLVIEKR